MPWRPCTSRGPAANNVGAVLRAFNGTSWRAFFWYCVGVGCSPCFFCFFLLIWLSWWWNYPTQLSTVCWTFWLVFYIAYLGVKIMKASFQQRRLRRARRRSVFKNGLILAAFGNPIIPWCDCAYRDGAISHAFILKVVHGIMVFGLWRSCVLVHRVCIWFCGATDKKAA